MKKTVDTVDEILKEAQRGGIQLGYRLACDMLEKLLEANDMSLDVAHALRKMYDTQPHVCRKEGK